MSVKVTTLLLCLYDYYKKPKSGKKRKTMLSSMHCFTSVIH